MAERAKLKCMNCKKNKYMHDKKIASGENSPHPFNPPGGYRIHLPKRKGDRK